MGTGASDGPAWLGIGAQRSGTTWFTDLLLQHPQVGLGRPQRKELHHLTPSLVVGSRADLEEAYLDCFRGLPGKPGEFTPAYLRCLWLPPIVRRLCRPDVVLLALLRDPIERFVSAMRHYRRLPSYPGKDPAALREWARMVGAEVQWGGMYATQLGAWAEVFPRSCIIVEQYEQVVVDPQSTVARVWAALGLDTGVALQDVDRPSSTSSGSGRTWSWDLLPGFRGALHEAYQPEVARLETEWGIDRGLWPNFD